MASNGDFSSSLNTKETLSVATGQRNVDAERKDVPQRATDIPATTGWRQWYLAFTSILPIYVAVHVAFVITTVFSVLFILPDFSRRSMPLVTLGQAWDRWDTKGYLAIAMHGYDSRPKIAFFPLYSLMIKCVMLLIHNPLLAGAIVSNLAGLVLLVHAVLAAAGFKLRAPRVQIGNLVLHGLGFLAFFQIEHCSPRSIAIVPVARAFESVLQCTGSPGTRHIDLFAPALRGTARTDPSVTLANSNPQ